MLQRSNEAVDLRSLDLDGLKEAVAPLGLPAYRAGQMFDWLQAKGVAGAGEMTDLPKALRGQLQSRYLITWCEIARRQESKDGTVKYLFRLHDGEWIESVVMRYQHGRSICVSSQCGCRMGCVFCASGANGCARGLLPGEILAQVQAAQRDLGEPIPRVVLMGMGEPLDNYENVLQFIKLASDPRGLCISQRKISLSTCGIVPGIDRLARERLGVTLSVSLHAPEDKLRSELMPVNRAWPLNELLRACKDYAQATSRRISFEYAMFRGENDSREQAEQLAALLRGMLCHVNLIPANAGGGAQGTEGRGMRGSDRETIRMFQEILAGKGIACTVRRSLGRDIDAACGQLLGKQRSPEP
ncbi:MAG: 23S rRNA (adenine(2503)-C(2))-methyltransferase RlmN [Oscillospiraceae bacterium]|nr:23S rRNA (adenine(2503)-C(2))-methyltransferase RlmN [Oscillospiraceae bacterium]